MSARLIAAAGLASWIPPPVPRAERNSPALVNMLTSFCVVGSASPVSAAKSVAETRAVPQWREAALITTTA
jgi:hypothetical protein